MIEAIRKLALSSSQAREVITAVCDEIAEVQKRHAERSALIERRMARGARLTDLRFRL
jgi:hypothetical protein